MVLKNAEPPFPVWILRGVSVRFWEEGFNGGIFGWTWVFTAFGIQ